MSILNIGAGASKGLEEYLLDMLREGQLEDARTRTSESQRSNRADEALRGRGLDESARARQAQEAANALTAKGLAEERLRQENNRTRDDMRAGLDDLLPGVTVSPQTHDAAVKTGAALPERFKSIVPFGEDFVGPIQEEGPQRNEATGYTLEGNKQAVNSSLEDFTLDGQHVQGNRDPRTNKITSLTGEDITARVKPWVKPAAPDHVLVQTGSGYMTREEALKLLAAGQDVPLATTGSTRTMQEGATMLRPNVKDLATMAQQLDQQGLFGPIMSRVRQAAVKIGTTGTPEEIQQQMAEVGAAIRNDPALNGDRLAGRFATTLGLMTSGMGRVHGGARGGGSIQMIEYLKSLLSDSSSLPMFMGRLDAMDTFLEHYEKGPNDKTPESPPAAAAPDLYQQYLDSQKTGPTAP